MTHGSGLQNVLDALDRHGSKVRPHGGYYTAQCPAHDDRTASLSVGQGEKGALLNCHASCQTADILAALDLPWPAIFDNEGNGDRRTAPDLWMPCQRKKEKPDDPEPCSGHKVAEYRYTDENGVLLFASARCSRKGQGCPRGFSQWQPDSSKKSGKRWSLQGVKRRVIYRLPEILEAIRAGRRIWFVEGEKDADLLWSIGEAATSSPMGAGAWLKEYAKYFRGAVEVIIVADCDDPGLDHAEAAYGDISLFCDSVKVVCSPVDMKGADTSNHFEYGLGVDDFEIVPFETVERRPQMVIQVEERHTLRPIVFEGFSSESVQEQLVGSMLRYGMSYDINPADIRNDKLLTIVVSAIARMVGQGGDFVLITPETVAAEIEQMGKGSYSTVLPYLNKLEQKAYLSAEMTSQAARVLRERTIRYGIVWSLRAAAEAAMKEQNEIPVVLEKIGELATCHQGEYADLARSYCEPTGDAFTGDMVEEVAREEGVDTRSNVRELRPAHIEQRRAATQRG